MASSGNFCVYNGLPYSTSFRTGLYNNSYSGVTNSGNTLSYPGNNCMGFGTMALTTGKKWYMEGIANNAYNTTMGIFEVNDANTIQDSLNTTYYSNTSYKSAFYHRDGTKYVDGANSSYGATFAIGDIIGMAVDLESATNTITFYKNNSSQGTFNLGTNGLDYLFCISRGTSGGAFFMNWGQDSSFGALKTAGGNADANGHGDFYYAPPSGHLALCSANLGIDSNIDPAQTDTEFPAKQFNAITYTGNSSTNAITGLGFQPDLVWFKRRDYTGNFNQGIIDSSRGVSVGMYPDRQDVDTSFTSDFNSFDSDGFTLKAGSSANINNSSSAFVAWCWKANGGTTASNSEGSITSTVQANTKAGFSIITFTSPDDSSDQTVGHGLDKAPEFIIAKNRDSTYNWDCYHHSLSDPTKGIRLNTNDAPLSGRWGTVNATTIGTKNAYTHYSTNKYVFYAWHSVEGYSKFGGYNGNANADGPFIYTGFRPRLLAIRNLGTAGDGWRVYDSARETHNVLHLSLSWHNSSAESTGSANNIDFLSNGFKCRAANPTINWGSDSYGPYIYMAWGDVPFKYNNTF